MYRFLSFEKIAFAHTFSAVDYRYENENRGFGIYGETPTCGGVLEIGFVEKNPLVLKADGTEYRLPEGSVFIIPPNTPFSVRTESPGLHSHTGAEFLVRMEKLPDNADAAREGTENRVFSLPPFLPPSENNREIISIIKRIADARIASLQEGYFEECELFMRLMRRIVEQAPDTGRKYAPTPGNRFLCKRVKTYISANLTHPVSVLEIAENIGVSKNYLTTVFTKTEGMPLTEYMNRLRLSYLTDLVRKYGYSFSEAGARVGFYDQSYLSRLFRKYYGMTFSEYKSLFIS